MLTLLPFLPWSSLSAVCCSILPPSSNALRSGTPLMSKYLVGDVFCGSITSFNSFPCSFCLPLATPFPDFSFFDGCFVPSECDPFLSLLVTGKHFIPPALFIMRLCNMSMHHKGLAPTLTTRKKIKTNKPGDRRRLQTQSKHSSPHTKPKSEVRCWFGRKNFTTA